jgi:hypothetical protein
VLDVAVGDEAGGEAEEGFVDVVASFPTDAEPSEAVGGVDHRPRPVELPRGSEPGQQHHMQQIPDAGLVPRDETPPARQARAEAQLLRQVLSMVPFLGEQPDTHRGLVPHTEVPLLDVGALVAAAQRVVRHSCKACTAQSCGSSLIFILGELE